MILRSRRALVLPCTLGTLVLSACAAAPPPGSPGPGAGSGRVGAAARPWEIPAEEFPSQRLFRMRFEGADGDGVLKVALRLESPERYRLTLSDRLGRTVYTVDHAPGRGWLLDHRERRACRLGAGLHLEGVPLEPFAVEALPAVLLGRLPAAPADAGRSWSRAGPAAGGGALDFRDRLGRRWTADTVDAGPGKGGPGGAGTEPAIGSWVLWRKGEPVLWWRRIRTGSGGEVLLSDRVRGVLVRWSEIAREPLGGPLPEPGPPAGFGVGACGTGR